MSRIFNSLCITAFILVGVCQMAGNAQAETVDLVFQVQVPVGETGGSVYLAGNWQGWNPGDESFRLANLGNSRYEITLAVEIGQTLQFKFTQGDWGNVEKGAQGEEISNRILVVAEAGTHEFQVATWAKSQRKAAAVSTISGDVQRIEVDGFLAGREVWIYLPPGYQDSPKKHYPVLYMFDGQNVFDAATSFAGEWQVDESCERLIAAGKMRPLIVVAVNNGGDQRIFEYTPWPDPQSSYGTVGGGRQHLQAMVEVLLPYINQHWRTLVGPENTGLAGSSLGGLMTLFAAGSYTDTFGLFAAVSPSLWWKNRYPLTYAEQKIRPPIRLYLDMGGLENGTPEDKDGNAVDDSLDDLRHLKRSLENSGFITGQDLLVVEDAQGKHNEAFWAKRFPKALRFLFPADGRRR